MRVLGALVALFVAGGCTSVRMTQRDGCWVKQTEKWPKVVTEELGPCARAETKWADDRLTRLVQECVGQADHRWQTRALEAWGRGEPLPAQQSEVQLLEHCMAQGQGAMLSENEALKARVAELDWERAQMHAAIAENRDQLRRDHGRVLDALAEAAKKPAPTAMATATSNGTATTRQQSDLGPMASGLAPSQGLVCAVPPAPRVEVRAKKAKKPLPECEPGKDAPPTGDEVANRAASPKPAATP